MTNDVSLDVLRQEAGQEGIGTLLFQEIREAVVSTVLGGRYPVRYSPTGRWNDEAFAELTQEFVADVLVEKRRLPYLFNRNDSLAGFRRGLRLLARHYLLRRHPPSVETVLLKRLAQVLSRSSEFRLVVASLSKGSECWALSTCTNSEVYSEGLDELIRESFAVKPLAVVRYRKDAKKRSHMVSTQELKRFVTDLMRTLGKAVSLADLVRLVTFHLNAQELATLSLSEPVTLDPGAVEEVPLEELLGTHETGYAGIELKPSADLIYGQLTDRQKRVLNRWEQGVALERIASEIGTSTTTAWNECTKVVELFAEAARLNDLSPEEVSQVFQTVVALVSLGGRGKIVRDGEVEE